MYPDIRYIHWIRTRGTASSPRIGPTISAISVSPSPTRWTPAAAGLSWLYQYRLMKATPEPRHLVTVRFEDFVLKQEETLRRLEAYLGIPLSRIIVRPDAVGRWKKAEGALPMDLLGDALDELGYEV